MTVLGVLISKLEYADDAALVSSDCEEATARVTRIAVEAKERADMEVSVPEGGQDTQDNGQAPLQDKCRTVLGHVLTLSYVIK